MDVGDTVHGADSQRNGKQKILVNRESASKVEMSLGERKKKGGGIDKGD